MAMAAPRRMFPRKPAARRRVPPGVAAHFRDGRRPAGWCQWRSCAMSTINFVADFFPRSVLELVSQSAALNHERLPFPLRGFGLFLLQHNPQALFGQRAEGRFLLARDALDALKKVVGNFDGRLHNMATHIHTSGHPDQAALPDRESIFPRTASLILMSGGHARGGGRLMPANAWHPAAPW